MGKGRVLVARVIAPAVVCFVVQVLLWLPLQARGEDAAVSMPAYCSVPPLPGLGIKPNLLLLIDNSASMYDLAYTDPGTFCLDDSFDPAHNYPGYFQQDKLYRYVVASDSFAVATGTGIDGSSCNLAGTTFFCVNVDAKKKADRFLATGKFLNWLAMSKLDLEKLALTGGKYDPATGRLQAESRGCQGKRYVKIVNDGNGVPLPVTFGVRGPIPSESGYVSQSSHGGPTRIDIYPARYNKDDCLAAVRKWQEGAGATDLADSAGRCLGPLYDANNVPTPGKIFTQALSLCYSHRAGAPILPGEVTLLQADCATRYLKVYGSNLMKIVKNTGDDVCARGIFHDLRNHEGITFSFGYLGQCYKMGTGGWLPQCAPYVIEDFCSDLTDPWLADPSANANQAGSRASLPSFILDAGITSLGAVALTAQVRLAPDAAPAGLVQQFASDINFGAMVFNDDGAGSECGGAIGCLSHCSNANDPVPHSECNFNVDCDGAIPNSGVCRPDPRKDGGRVISYLNLSPLGDHSSGLVAAIDAVRGTSWTPLAETFYEAIGYFAGNPSFRFQPEDYDTAYPPSKYGCQRNNVLILSDGMSTADRAAATNGFVEAAVARWGGGGDPMPASQVTGSGTAATAAPENAGSYNLDDLAWIARHRNIIDPAQPIELQRQYITTHVVYTGPPCGDPGTGTGYNADGSCATGDEGVPEKMMQLTAAKGGGSIKTVQDPAGLQNALKGVFQQVIGGPNAGTSSSILATGEGNGALFLQPQFYPNKSFDGGQSSAAWIGELQALWYYIDPFVGSSGAASGIREDTDGDKTLDLKRDRVVRFVSDPALGEARARLYLDADGDGVVDPGQPAGYPLEVAPEAVQSLWRAGRQLREKGASDRTIYTQTDGASLVPFLDGSVAGNRQLLLARDQAEAEQIVAFVRGIDDSEGRSGAPTRDRGVAAYGGSDKKVWKLGDIVSSAPVLQTSVPLGSYHLPPPRGYGDGSYLQFIDPGGTYANRGTVYVGANDGMLHAFRLGMLKVRPGKSETWPADRKAVLLGSGVGEEEWAFVPQNALPYLRYLKEPLYPHLYFVDGPTALVDACIGDPERCSRDDYWNCLREGAGSWRTVLIGGMGLGGASRPAGASCSDQGSSATCVKAPAVGVGGLSSYFALDVTGQGGDGSGTPRLLWEFSHPELGFATSGAAVLRIKARTLKGTDLVHDTDKNGRWFAVFASGPTGAVERESRSFTGTSDQNLKLFVIDLNAVPPLTLGRNYWVIDTGIANAFGGSMAGAGIDADKWDSSPAKVGQYEDDALYLGYTRLAAGGGWTGGVLRLFTGHDPDPGNWKTSRVIDDVGPVTGAVAKLQDRQYKRLWLYFGGGRYFNTQDDLSPQRALYGVSEPCYAGDNTLRGDCSTPTLKPSDLNDVSDVATAVLPRNQGSGYQGWRILLDPASGALGSERVVDSPASVTGGAVFFPTFKPPLDPCLEGVSYLWGVHYSSGAGIPLVSAQALVPLANGSSAEIDVGSLGDRGKRRSAPLPGKALKPRLVTNSGLKPLKKIIHIQER
ncbi:pilus assembly protein PilY [Geomonas sp. Red69]|uniref:pilus assembly protein n=1 Tax=Geomonas diazotrophica TaxID=2843197 RepID=UPI001C0FBBE0|nr:pilus assembly protein PilY [Geomonas diazotrophica]MBU5637655.1 pilus assembly protein PilY [Geomonas diazotrophica]